MGLRLFQKIVIDTVLWVGATIIAFLLRFEDVFFERFDFIVQVALVLTPIKLGVILVFGHQKISWRHTSVMDLFTPFKSILAFTLFFLIGAFFFDNATLLPLSIPLIDMMVSLVFLALVRLTARLMLKERKIIPYYRTNDEDKKRIIIAGAGESGTMIANEMLRHPEIGLLPIGFLDDAPNKQKQRILGLPVLGRIGNLRSVVNTKDVDELIIAMPSEDGDVIRRVVNEAQKVKLPSRTIPGLYDLISGKVSINQLRNVEVEDLLRRKPVILDNQKIKSYIHNRVVLVTGAGGSIGSEIVRQVSRFKPSKIVLLGRGENSIHHIYREFLQHYTNIPFDVKITDVRDIVSLEKVFKEMKPDVIFHAAAHKHVTLMELNPDQAILNNIGGTRNLVNLSLEYGVKCFVNISSDKSVNPSSVMGATKRIAEYVVNDAARKASPGQLFVSVRFGNVLGSRGSVVPIFKEQIKNGGPITITHPEMYRYFMTIPEASQLVLQAGALGVNGAVFVLDMGEPVKILDMARDLIRLSGYEPDKDIKIVYTGVQQGEKLFEELLTAEEGTDMTPHNKIFIARKNDNPANLNNLLDGLIDAANGGNYHTITENLQALIPSYSGLRQTYNYTQDIN
jgi:FlaA1/EpsC-like NDP-sugar epimerase